MSVTDQKTARNESSGDNMSGEQQIRVLHVVLSLNRGGIETWLLDVMRHMDRQRFAMDALVATNKPSSYDEEFRQVGARVIACPQAARPWRYGRNFRDVLERYGPYKIVHSHFNPCGYPLVWAHKAGVPVRIAHSHNALPELRSQGKFLQTLFCL